DFLHVVRFGCFIRVKEIIQRRGRGQQGSGLTSGQIIVLQCKKEILPHTVLIAAFQNFLRRLCQQPVLELLLFRKHFLIKGCVQFRIGHRASASFSWVLDRGVRSGTAAFSSASTDGLRPSSFVSAFSSSGASWLGLSSMFRRASSSASRADFAASSSSCGKGLPSSA